MDALARVEPAARPLMREVDNALLSLGAPAEHRIWSLFRQVGTSPGGVVAYLADVDPHELRTLARSLRSEAEAYGVVIIPAAEWWQGAAGGAYAAQATALRAHLGEGGDPDGAATMIGRLRATAAYVDSVADWYEASRRRLSRLLAEILTSAQALTVRSCPALGGGLAELARLRSGVPIAALSAAADIGACVLDVADDALAEGRELAAAFDGRLAELPYQAPARTPGCDSSIHVIH